MSQITEKEKEFVEKELKKISRKIEVRRIKKFALNKIICRVIIDGKVMADVENGGTIEIALDGLPHKIACQWIFTDSVRFSETLQIPYGTVKLSYTTSSKVHQEKKITLKGLNIISTPIGVLEEDKNTRAHSDAVFSEVLRKMLSDFRRSRELPSEFKNENVLVYEYRTYKWSRDEISNHIREEFTKDSKKINIALTVGSEDEVIPLKSDQWDVSRALQVIKQGVKENFGDRFDVKIIKSVATTNLNINPITSILIKELQNCSGGFPELEFLIVGEQITLKQLNLSIHSILLPQAVGNKTGSVEEENEKIINRMMLIKRGEDPRINNYIKMVRSTITEILNSWLNHTVN